MASFFGSVATEVGGTIKDLATQKREERLADEEARREMQLAKQRMQHEAGLVDKRISADDLREKRRQEFESDRFDQETQRRASEAETTHGYEKEITRMQEESDIIQTIIASSLRNRKSRSMSGEGWKVEFDERQSFDPETGEPVFTDVVNATSPSGRPYRIVGGMAFEAGGPTQPKTQALSEDQRYAMERDLLEGKDSPEAFMRIHGYLPSNFIFGKVTQDEPDVLRSISEAFGGSMPAWFMGGRSSDRRRGDQPPPKPEPKPEVQPEPKPEPEAAEEVPPEDMGPPAAPAKDLAAPPSEEKSQIRQDAGGRLREGQIMEMYEKSPVGAVQQAGTTAASQVGSSLKSAGGSLAKGGKSVLRAFGVDFSDQDADEVAGSVASGMQGGGEQR
jgi:hypothetical protein